MARSSDSPIEEVDRLVQEFAEAHAKNPEVLEQIRESSRMPRRAIDTLPNVAEDEELRKIFAAPTKHKPGSAEKIATMRLRYLLGTSIFEDDDVQEKLVPYVGQIQPDEDPWLDEIPREPSGRGRGH